MGAWFRLLTVAVVSFASVGDLHAGLGSLFRRNKIDPAEQVPALLKILKSDKDEGNRVEAAEELRNYSPATFDTIFPGLIDAFQNDPAASVRIAAIESVGKLRPMSAQVGYALEQALAHDSTAKVRTAAKAALAQYTLLGYRSNKPQDGQAVQSSEPPLAPAKVSASTTDTVANARPRTPTPVEAIPTRTSSKLPPLPTTMAPVPTPVPATTVAKAEPRGFLPRLFGKPEPTPVAPPVQPQIQTQPPAVSNAIPTANAKAAPALAVPASVVPRSTLNQSMEPPLANPLGTAPVPADRSGSKRSILPPITSPATVPVATPTAPAVPVAPTVPVAPLLPARPNLDPESVYSPVLAPRK